jgi:ribosomal protein S18 acetylase RimI-like enzyme
MTTTIEKTRTIEKATVAEAPRLAETLARAFLADPVTAYFVPDPNLRMRELRSMFRRISVARIAAPHDLMYRTANYEAVALWLPPGNTILSPGESLRLLPSMVATFRRRTLHAVRAMAVMDEHHPDVPYYNLHFIGTDPAHQGKGHGADLMRPLLERFDAEGVPAFLESSTRRNHSFYRRHGFELTGEFNLPNGGPPLWTFWREVGAPISG